MNKENRNKALIMKSLHNFFKRIYAITREYYNNDNLPNKFPKQEQQSWKEHVSPNLGIKSQESIQTLRIDKKKYG